MKGRDAELDTERNPTDTSDRSVRKDHERSLEPMSIERDTTLQVGWQAQIPKIGLLVRIE